MSHKPPSFFPIKKQNCIQIITIFTVFLFWCFKTQIETGGIAITPRPSEVGAEIKPAMPMRPFFGIEPALLDKKVKGIEVPCNNNNMYCIIPIYI